MVPFISKSRCDKSEKRLKGDKTMLKSEPGTRITIDERAVNFRWNTEKFKALARTEEELFNGLDKLKDNIVLACDTQEAKQLPKEDLLKKIFIDIYNFIEPPAKSELIGVLNDASVSKAAFEALLFTTLGMFLHSTKRIKGKRLRDFIYDHSPLNYRSTEYPRFYLEQETTTLRKARNRRLSLGKAYYKNSQWEAITKDAEHEWTFYYALNSADAAVQDTFKRLGNLYKGLDAALDAEEDNENYLENLKVAYEKFESKLHKIKYSNFVELQKTIIAHINADQTYFGLNLYRLERKLKPFIIASEIKGLTACEKPKAERKFLLKTTLLRGIEFPEIYQALFSMQLGALADCCQEFLVFRSTIEMAGCLVLDELVERGVFGEDWEDLFRSMTNELASTVLYDIDKMDFTITESSQTAFEKILAAPVQPLFSAQADENKSV